MSKRNLIQLKPEERKPYVAEAKTIILCTNGPRGYPHAVAMWFVTDDDETVWMTTYAKSQKAVNIRRNPKVALHVESGTVYDQLKGVLIQGDAELINDPEVVFGVLKRVHSKMFGSFPEGIDDAMRAQALKRVAIKVSPRHISSWDHAKLVGTY